MSKTYISILESTYYQIKLASASLIKFPSYDQKLISGIYYQTGDRNKKSPAIVLIHGGPTEIDVLTFNNQVQYLVHSGYSVLQINNRGSTGFGRKFMEDIIGRIGRLQLIL